MDTPKMRRNVMDQVGELLGFRRTPANGFPNGALTAQVLVSEKNAGGWKFLEFITPNGHLLGRLEFTISFDGQRLLFGGCSNFCPEDWNKLCDIGRSE